MAEDIFLPRQRRQDPRRSAFVDEALLAVDDSQIYELDGHVCEFITVNYQSMSAFTAAQDLEVTRAVAALFPRLGIVIPDLEPLDRTLRAEVIRQRRYAITVRDGVAGSSCGGQHADVAGVGVVDGTGV
ncbi:hypothetical protein [Micromonospora sp. NPDC005324]|uniref:hypothetical protein n=1 Tax=Micromonospora sp. NPDC005324 TaxID=3157033 RepID=UPI0033B9F848